MGPIRGFQSLTSLVKMFTDAGDLEISSTDSTSLLKFFTNTANAVEASTVQLGTTGASATNIWTRAVPLSTTVSAVAFVTGKKEGANADGLVAVLWNGATNNAGTTAILNATAGGSVIENSAAAPTVAFVANNTTDTLDLQVSGVAAEDWAWTALVLALPVSLV